MADKNRTCKTCGITKPLVEFPPHQKSGYYKRTCHPCTNAKRQEYKHRSPENYLWSRLGRQNKNAHQVEIKIAKEDLRNLWDQQGGKCAVTGLHMTYYPRAQRYSTGLNASVDRIDSSGIYSQGNVRLVCSRVNMMRAAGEDADLMWWCKQILEGLGGE